MVQIYSDAKKEFNNIEIIICCGKGLGPKGEVDWVLASRVGFAVDIALNNTTALLLLSGGIGLTADKSQKNLSEADAMEVHVRKFYPEIVNRIAKEDTSTGTLEQLCIIKENYIIKNNYKRIAIVSDEIHIKRISVLFDAVLGDDHTCLYFGSKIKLYGKYRQLIEDHENVNLKGAKELVKKLPRGNQLAFKDFDKAYRELRKLKLLKGGSRLDYIGSQEVLEFIKTKII